MQKLMQMLHKREMRVGAPEERELLIAGKMIPSAGADAPCKRAVKVGAEMKNINKKSMLTK